MSARRAGSMLGDFSDEDLRLALRSMAGLAAGRPPILGYTEMEIVERVAGYLDALETADARRRRPTRRAA